MASRWRRTAAVVSAEALGEARHRDGALLAHQAGDPRTRPVDFHNTIVHLFAAARHEG